MEIEAGVVEHVARRIVGDSGASLRGWTTQSLMPGVSGELGQTQGLQRVSGTAHTGRGAERWSVIVKTLQDREYVVGDVRPDVHDPHGVQYWRREAEAYRSGVLDAPAEDFGAPRCYRVEDLGHEAVIWMEDVVAERAGPWPLERYWTAARHLGSFNGRHAGRVPRRPVRGHRGDGSWSGPGTPRRYRTDAGQAADRLPRDLAR